MTIIRAGLLNQSFGRVSGTCDGASAPGGLTFSGSGLQLGEQVEAASKELSSDRQGGDVLAAAGRGAAAALKAQRIALRRDLRQPIRDRPEPQLTRHDQPRHCQAK